MKKQLLRYKLKADQKVGRANKNEVLTDELLQIEKRLEHTRLACQSVYKRISQCLQSSGPDLDKRLKKLPETAVAHAMQEASNQLMLESESALRKSLRVCAEAENGIAKEKALYEMFVEGHVVTPLNILVETDIPNIQKMRERLKRLVLDRDNATQAWQKAYKAQYNPGANIPLMAAKADSMKDDMDAAITRMELCKDQLITELFEFLSKEGTYAQHITDFVSKELEYHRRCVAHLEKLEPDLKAAQENAYVRSSYGCSLAEHLRVTEREIALPIESCIHCLVENGMYEEGLFRVAGGAAKLKKFRALADAGVGDLTVYDAQDDIHAVAGALKQYLRELPDPLLTQDLYHDWLRITSINDNDAKLREIWTVIDKLPAENKANLRYLVKFCSVLSQRQEYNKMSAGNISLVFAPNLLWAPNDDITANVMVSNSVAGIVESMIVYVDYFFPGEPDFNVPPPPQSGGDKNSGQNRSLSSSSMGEVKAAANNPSNNQLQHQPKSPTHSRNSSSDTGIVLNSHPGENTLKTKKKKHAPPAPQGQSRTSPVMGSAAPNEASHQKPPVASKRTSVRQRPNIPPPERPNMPPPERPNMPPPEPPENSHKNGPVSPTQTTSGPHPRPRPKPPVRKRVLPLTETPVKHDLSKQTHAVEDFPPPISEEEPLPQSPTEEGGASPTMPDLPPPPLPQELDNVDGPTQHTESSFVTAPLAAESSEEEEEEERDFIVTSL